MREYWALTVPSMASGCISARRVVDRRRTPRGPSFVERGRNLCCGIAACNRRHAWPGRTRTRARTRARRPHRERRVRARSSDLPHGNSVVVRRIRTGLLRRSSVRAAHRPRLRRLVRIRCNGRSQFSRLAMLVDVVAGPALLTLLMGAHSRLILLDAAVGFVANIRLNVVLIPPFGMIGAAIAWSVSILLMNFLAVRADPPPLGRQGLIVRSSWSWVVPPSATG